MAEVILRLSDEAQLLMVKTGINPVEFMDWFCKERKVWVGGGDVVAFLRFKEMIKNGK